MSTAEGAKGEGKGDRPIDRIREIVERDPTYRVEAYCWVYEALEHTLSGLGLALGESRHVTGQELCFGMRRLALERFGPLARAVLRSWGVTRTEDFGKIVFRLIDAQLMRRNEGDSITDFDAVFDFAEALAPEQAPRARLLDVFRVEKAAASAPVPAPAPATAPTAPRAPAPSPAPAPSTAPSAPTPPPAPAPAATTPAPAPDPAPAAAPAGTRAAKPDRGAS